MSIATTTPSIVKNIVAETNAMTGNNKKMDIKSKSEAENSLMALVGIQRALRATVAAMADVNEGEYTAIHFLSSQMHDHLRLLEKAIFPDANGAISDPENPR